MADSGNISSNYRDGRIGSPLSGGVSGEESTVTVLMGEEMVEIVAKEEGIMSDQEVANQSEVWASAMRRRDSKEDKKTQSQKASRKSKASSTDKSNDNDDLKSQKVEERFKELLPDFNLSKLNRFSKNIEEDPPKSKEDVLRRLTDEFEDVSHQYAAVEYNQAVINELLSKEDLSEEKRGKLEALLKELKGASSDLLKRQGSEIRAGLNVSALADMAAKKGLGGVQDLRSYYRNEILGHVNILSTFKALVKKFGKNKIEKASDFVHAAASKDLASDGPSIDKAKLGDIVGDLEAVRTLSTFFKWTRETLEMLSSNYKGIELKAEAGDVLMKLLDVTQTPKQSMLGELSKEIGIPGERVEVKERFIRECKSLLHDMPVNVYSSMENRDLVMDNAQRELDEVTVELEEKEDIPDELDKLKDDFEKKKGEK